MDTSVSGLSGPTPDVFNAYNSNLRRWENRLPWFEWLTQLFTRKRGDYASYSCDWDEGRLKRFRRFIAILNRNIVAMEQAMREFARDHALVRLWEGFEAVLLKLAETFDGTMLGADVEMALPSGQTQSFS